MTLAFDENMPILVAPRPVRIASEPCPGYYSKRCNTPLRLVSAVTDHHERVKIGELDVEERFNSSSPEMDLGSPRSSPR